MTKLCKAAGLMLTAEKRLITGTLVGQHDLLIYALRALPTKFLRRHAWVVVGATKFRSIASWRHSDQAAANFPLWPGVVMGPIIT